MDEDVEKGNSGNTEGPETSKIEDIIVNPGPKRSRERKSSGFSSSPSSSSGSCSLVLKPSVTKSDVTNLSDSQTCVVKESTDEAYTNIASILATKPFVEYFKEKVNTYTQCFKNPQDTEKANSDPEISVEGMKSAISGLHPTQNPFHSCKNVVTGCLSVLKVKSGNKELLIAELEKIDDKKGGFISRNAFRVYVHKNEESNKTLHWHYCCDGNPENKAASGTLMDYFFAIAEAKKVRLFPTLGLFPLLALTHILVCFKATQALKNQLKFSV